MEDDGSDYGSEGDDDGTSSELGRDEDEEELNNENPSFQSELESEPDTPTISTSFAAKSTMSYEDPKHTENLSSTLRKTRDEDRKKGKAVSKQIVRLIVLFILVLLTAFEGIVGLAA
jgi:protein AATF/BFR2